MDKCEICRGSRRIRLPRYIPLTVEVLDAPMPSMIDNPYKEYPCPECSAGDNAPYERLEIITSHSEGRSEIQQRHPGFMEALRYGTVRKMAEEMLRRGLIRFEESKPDHRGIFALRGTLGVVAPAKVAEFEERVRERQFEVAAGLVEANIEEIANWGSYYNGREGGSVGKWQAVEWLQEAFKKVREKYAKTPNP